MSKGNPPHFHFQPGKVAVLQDIFDASFVRKGWVIPLPRNRAFRFGFGIELWGYRGPRRYDVVAAPSFVESMSAVTGDSEEQTREWLDDMGIPVVEEKTNDD